MSQPTAITAAVFDRILAFLVPLFLETVGGDTEAARAAARALLDSYEARTNRELRLAALAIAFGFGALDALSRATDPALAMAQVMRLRGNANALNRSAVQNEARLEKLHRKLPEVSEADAEPLPASTATPDLLSFARAAAKPLAAPASAATPAAFQPAPSQPAPLSRQQRRAAERQAEKQHRRRQQEARLAQRTAALRDGAKLAA